MARQNVGLVLLAVVTLALVAVALRQGGPALDLNPLHWLPQ